MLPRPRSREIDRKARLAKRPVEIPITPPEERVLDFDEVYLPWTPEMAKAEASRCLHCPSQPCVKACPLGIDIPSVLWLTEHGDFEGAAEIISRSNNLPEICGRVCPQSQLCEGACPHLKDGNPPVAVGRIESFLADTRRKEIGWSASRPPCTGHRVAVVGSGPAGLTVAELLAERGHCLTVFEQWPDGGGLLRYGIPRFKLAPRLVRARVGYLREMGVEFVFDTRIGEDTTVDDLFHLGFEAVFLGTGAGRPVPAPIPGSEAPGVYHASSFLVRANVEQNVRPSELEDPPVVGNRVVVLGGGDTAMDCCRTALRLGAREVTCVYRRTEAEMPGNPRDRALAVEEGARFLWLSLPQRIVEREGGGLQAVECCRARLGSTDESGRRGPEPVPDSTFHIQADTVVLALGYLPDPSLARSGTGLETDREGLVVADPRTGRTSRKMVWAAGDTVSGPSLVPTAVAQARAVAADIHQKLSW